jgi:integrase/recombinase XerD
MGSDPDSNDSGHDQKTMDARVQGSRASVRRAATRRPAGDGQITKADADAILGFEAAFNPQDTTQQLPHDLYPNGRSVSYKEPGTRRAWLQRLNYFAKRLELTDVTAEDLNAFTTEKVKSGDWSEKTAKNYEETLKKFYRYHDNLGVEPREIATHEPDRVTWDERDMLDAEERHALTVEAPTHPRDEAIANLLMYTGMRNTALRMCRVKDIDLEKGVYYFNSEADGLKGIHRPRQPRPLLHAEGPVREWLQYHPEPEPDAYLLTTKPAYTTVDPFEPVSDKAIQYVMRELTKEAFDVEKASDFPKPTHPHMLRHNFVTICKRNWELPDETVKFYIGHAPDSTVMETTYAHLGAEDHLDRGQVAAGLKDESEIDSHPDVPEVCRCGTPLPPDAVACPKCGITYSAEAQSVQEQFEGDVQEDKEEVESVEEYEERDKLERLVRENPELIEVLEDLADE